MPDFSPAFRYLHIIFQYHIAITTPSAAVYGRAGCITFHYLQFGRSLGIPFTTTNNSFFKCRNVGLSGIRSVQYRNEQKFLCQSQSDTEMLRYLTEIQKFDTSLRHKAIPVAFNGLNLGNLFLANVKGSYVILKIKFFFT